MVIFGAGRLFLRLRQVQTQTAYIQCDEPGHRCPTFPSKFSFALKCQSFISRLHFKLCIQPALQCNEKHILLLSNFKYFTFLDFAQGYFHLPVHNDSQKHFFCRALGSYFVLSSWRPRGFFRTVLGATCICSNAPQLYLWVQGIIFVAVPGRSDSFPGRRRGRKAKQSKARAHTHHTSG